MFILLTILVMLISYLLGSIPFGLLVVRLSTGKDLRKVESGRTGGTNALRAAGWWAGIATAVLDVLKSTITVWIVRAVFPLVGLKINPWVEILAPLAAILGHNYSIFLIEPGANGRIRLRGGAGGAPTVGGALGLWPPSLFFILPISIPIFYFIGYASVTTMSLALIATVVFVYRAWIGASPWQYAIFGLISEAMLVYALVPNIRRLINGTERIVGWRARHKKPTQADHSSS